MLSLRILSNFVPTGECQILRADVTFGNPATNSLLSDLFDDDCAVRMYCIYCSYEVFNFLDVAVWLIIFFMCVCRSSELRVQQ
jgi:hypothetical protein